MSGPSRAAPDAQRGHVVFVVGMRASGVDITRSALVRLGLRSLGSERDPGSDALGALNDRLLEAAGGSPHEPPEIAPPDLVRVLAPFADEGRKVMADAMSAAAASGPGEPAGPWVWADPRLSFLAPFWADVLEIEPAVVLVHREPAAVLAAVGDGTGGDVLAQWDRHNRSAMVLCSQWPAMVLGYDELVAKPAAAIPELAAFLGARGMAMSGSVEDAVAYVEGLPGEPGAGEPAIAPLDNHYRILARVLDKLDGRHGEDHAEEGFNLAALMDAVSGFYDADYYGTSYDKSGVPYRREEKLWVDLFAAIAGAIVQSLSPGTVLDVGCASGMLVEALRRRGVDARGIDISTWAIDQIPSDIRPFCTVGSVTEELDGQYDLIVCSEVLEHLPPALAADAVANLCRHSDAVLFSSTPSHFDEPTHLNVEPGSYWARLFFREGFVRDVDYDASFLAPHAVLFRRRDVDLETMIADYERGLSKIALDLGAHLEEAVAEHDRLAERYNALATGVGSAGSERDRLAAEVERLTAVVSRRSAEAQAAFDMIHFYESSERRLAALVEVRDAELEAIRRTKTFVYTTTLRRLYGWLRRSRRAPVESGAPPHPPDGTYELWIEQFDTLDDAARDAIAARVGALADAPLISVVMPVYNPPADLLRAAIESVRSQLYSKWELCIADDNSPEPHVAAILGEYEALDSRIKVTRRSTNGHISAASNSALGLATGQWVACLDHDDVLADHALALVAEAIAAHPGAGLVYSDEDKLDVAGRRADPYFKPEFDPLLLLGQNYLTHLCVLRRDLVTDAGGYREGYEGSQDWDLALRVTERLEPSQVVHVPHVLYHWRAHAGSTAAVVSAKPYAVDAGRRAVEDHLARTGRAGRVSRIAKSGHNRVIWADPGTQPLVSIVIPTRDGRLLQRCIESVLTFTTYPNFEILVVDNSSRTLPTLQYLRAYDDRVTVVRDERPFNYAAINNAAVRRASGDVVCLLNDDTEVIAGDWLTEMVGHLLQPGVGGVGAKLYYDDGRIQHAGVVLGIGGVAGHSHRFFDRLSSGYFGRLQVAHNVSAVTAACMAVRREAWDAVGGLDEVNLPIAFNDVDFCIRLREAGWGIVWTPYAELFHHESISRGPDDVGPRAPEFARETDYIKRRWGPATLRSDPYYNPNLSLVAEDFSLAWPPRTSYR
jgi:GT2 family glycosyltransferase/cyclopropane fatty-acyl-phospholipid synthase-like methyltransferase